MKKWLFRSVLGGLGLAGAGILYAEETRQPGPTETSSLPPLASLAFAWPAQTDVPAAGAMAPESLVDVLGLLYQGAAGKTAAQMQTVLFAGLPPEAVESETKARRAALNGYRVIHALWCDAETQLVPAFEAKAREVWGVQLGIWPAGALGGQRVAEINRWFAEQTRGAVTQVLEPEDTGRAFLVGVALAAFAAPWANDVFADGQTGPEFFYASAEERFEVLMMRGKPILEYSEDDDFQFVRIAYADSSLGLYLLLPKRAAEAEAAFAKADGGRWQTLAAAAKPRTVALSLPKVNVSERIDWRARLRSGCGLDRPFASGMADFSKLATHPAGLLALGSLVQRAWVRWDERGTEARAETTYALEPFGEAPPPPQAVAFVANHPFSYVIGDLAAGRVLFVGRIGRSEQMPSPPGGAK